MSRRHGWFVVGVLAAAVAAFAVRAPRLSQRLMHPDEANQAQKALELRQSGVFVYDPHEHHGPTLYWLTLPVLRLAGVERLADSDEWLYRIVPVLFGAALVVLLIPAAGALGRGAVLAAAVLTVVSPAMVFYSRYYIQETLLVVFTWTAILSGWRYMRRPSFAWAVAAGGSIGLMHATKETWILAAAAAAAATALAAAWGRIRDRAMTCRDHAETCDDGAPLLACPAVPSGNEPARHSTAGQASGGTPAKAACRPTCVYVRCAHALAASGAAIAVAVAFYSSFGADWEGPIRSITAYSTYLHRGTQPTLHANPLNFYLEVLFAFRPARGFFFSEGFLAALAVVGIAAALLRRATPDRPMGLARFLAFYAPILLLLYSAVRYKTPWCMLSFLQALILLAGLGAATLLRLAPRWWGKAVVGLLLMAGTTHLAWQAYRLNYQLPDDPRNPYVYAHTARDVRKLATRMEELAAVAPQGQPFTIHVVTPENYWPLPWYLRQLDPERIGYWADAEDWARDVAQAAAPEVIVTTADVQDAVDARLRAPYNRQMLFRLRPELFVSVYVREDLWQKFLAAQTADAAVK